MPGGGWRGRKEASGELEKKEERAKEIMGEKSRNKEEDRKKKVQLVKSRNRERERERES